MAKIRVTVTATPPSDRRSKFSPLKFANECKTVPHQSYCTTRRKEELEERERESCGWCGWPVRRLQSVVVVLQTSPLVAGSGVADVHQRDAHKSVTACIYTKTTEKYTKSTQFRQRHSRHDNTPSRLSQTTTHPHTLHTLTPTLPSLTPATPLHTLHTSSILVHILHTHLLQIL